MWWLKYPHSHLGGTESDFGRKIGYPNIEFSLFSSVPLVLYTGNALK
jgi:hypothetical protein